MKTDIKTKKITTHQKFRVSEKDAKAFVCQKLAISEYEYNLQQYEAGIRFLEYHFPSNDPFYLKYHIHHEKSKSFWNWFKNEWHMMEQDLVKFLLENKMTISHQIWIGDMNRISRLLEVEKSFNQFIKIFKNGII